MDEDMRHAIDGVKELMTAQHNATEGKMDLVIKTVGDHHTAIDKLYNLDRKQQTEIDKLAAKVQPAIKHTKNSHKWTAAFIVSAIGVLGASFAKSIVNFVKGGA